MSITDTSMGLAEAERRIIALGLARTEEEERHKRETERVAQALAEAMLRRNLILAGAPLETVELAETILEVYRPENAHIGDGPQAITAAISALANGGLLYHPGTDRVAHDLRIDYFGTKNYAQWRGQRSDGRYGTAPSHGSMIFWIGLQPVYRKGRNHDSGSFIGGKDIGEAEQDAAIAYLHALLRMKP